MKMIATSSLILLVCGLLHATSGEAGVTIGSDTQVQSVARTRILGANNRIARYAEMAAGFILNNSATACTFDSTFPVYGNIDMNGGQLTLTRNLMLEGSATLPSLGRINANGNSLYLAESMSSFGSASDGTIILDAIDLVLRSDITLNAVVKFTGSSSIVSRNHTLKLGPTGALIVGSGANLSIVNTSVQAIGANNISCESASSQLILDNVSWDQSGNLIFSTGGIVFKNWVQMSGAVDSVFAYRSTRTSVIENNALLTLSERFTFSYDPSSGAGDLLQFAANTSRLFVDGATIWSVPSSFELKKGNLHIGREAIFMSNGAVKFGDGVGANDCVVTILGGAHLNFKLGILENRNAFSSSWRFTNEYSALCAASGATIALYESIHLGNGFVKLFGGAILARATDKSIFGSLMNDGPISLIEL